MSNEEKKEIKKSRKLNKSINSKNKSKLKKASRKYNKKLLSFFLGLALGISLVPLGLVLGLDFELYSDNQMVRDNYPLIFFSVKEDFEHEYESLIEDMRNDPLNGLFLDKLPTPEEIFFEEWANDRFPEVDIPTIGGYIESVGARAVGDINLDGQLPEADLNISSIQNPSEITQEQCHALWNPDIHNSLVYRPQSIWFNAATGNQNNREELRVKFNLTETQIILICEWINIALNSWLLFLAREERLTWNPLLLIGFIAAGGVLIGYSAPKVRRELKKSPKKGIKDLKSTP